MDGLEEEILQWDSQLNFIEVITHYTLFYPALRALI